MSNCHHTKKSKILKIWKHFKIKFLRGTEYEYYILMNVSHRILMDWKMTQMKNRFELPVTKKFQPQCPVNATKTA
jgi:hypothetical protein